MLGFGAWGRLLWWIPTFARTWATLGLSACQRFDHFSGTCVCVCVCGCVCAHAQVDMNVCMWQVRPCSTSPYICPPTLEPLRDMLPTLCPWDHGSRSCGSSSSSLKSDIKESPHPEPCNATASKLVIESASKLPWSMTRSSKRFLFQKGRAAVFFGPWCLDHSRRRGIAGSEVFRPAPSGRNSS